MTERTEKQWRARNGWFDLFMRIPGYVLAVSIGIAIGICTRLNADTEELHKMNVLLANLADASATKSVASASSAIDTEIDDSREPLFSYEHRHGDAEPNWWLDNPDGNIHELIDTTQTCPKYVRLKPNPERWSETVGVHDGNKATMRDGTTLTIPCLARDGGR